MLAAATPLAFSLVGDLFSAEDRANACALVAAALGGGDVISPTLPFPPLPNGSSGGLLGQMFAGIVTPNEQWRLSFVSIGGVTCVVACVTYASVSEPKRGAKESKGTGEGAVGEPRKKERRALCVPTNLLLFVQVCGC